jgi:hypothetical protein
MLEVLRARLHQALTSPLGDAYAPIRIPKDLARRLNVALGRPLCHRDELEERRAARAKLAMLREERAQNGGAPARPSTRPGRDPVPVTVYFEKGRGERDFGKIKAVLEARKISFRALDVSGDETTMAFVVRTAKCAEDELPIVFVGVQPIGNARALVEADVAGDLVKAVFGPS